MRTLSWRTNKQLQKLWKNKNSLKKTCILFLFLVWLFIFPSLTQEKGNKMTFKCPLLSYRDHIEKDVHLQLNPSLPCPLLSAKLSTPSPKVRTSFWMPPIAITVHSTTKLINHRWLCNKKLFPDLKHKSHFIRNTSDLKLKRWFLICETLLYYKQRNSAEENRKIDTPLGNAA